MENVNEHEKQLGQSLEGWHREANAALTKLQNTIIEYCINHTGGIFVPPPITSSVVHERARLVRGQRGRRVRRDSERGRRKRKS